MTDTATETEHDDTITQTTTDQTTDTSKPHGDDDTDWKAEARKWENRAKENTTAARKLAKLEEAQKTEQQKLTERAEKAEARVGELETKLSRTTLRQEVVTAATTAGAVDPDAVYRLLDTDDLLDEAGQPTGVDKAVAKLLKDRPYLAGGRGTRDAAERRTSDNPSDMNALIRRQAGRA